MPSMPRLFAILLPVLLLALSSCWRRENGPTPVQPTVIPQGCITEELASQRPKMPTPIACSRQGNSVADCLAHYVIERDEYIDRLFANCGVTP